MSFNPLELAKKHPVALGVGVFAVGVVLVLMFSGGSSTATQPVAYAGSTVDPSTVAANTALTQSQLAAGVQNQQTAAQLQTNLAGFAAQSEAYKLQNNTDNLALNLQSSVALAQITAQKDTQTLVSQLSASVSQAQIDAQKQMQANNNSTQTQIAQISATMQTQQQGFLAAMQDSMNNRDIRMNDSNNATQANLAAIYANTTLQGQAIASDLSKFNTAWTQDTQRQMFAQQVDLSKFNTAWTQDTLRQQTQTNADLNKFYISSSADLQKFQTAWTQDTMRQQAGYADAASARQASLDAARIAAERQHQDSMDLLAHNKTYSDAYTEQLRIIGGRY